MQLKFMYIVFYFSDNCVPYVAEAHDIWIMTNKYILFQTVRSTSNTVVT